MKSISFDTTNALCGGLLTAVGLFFAWQAFNLELGTAFRMGPGYFPLVLAVILTLLGIVILVLRPDGSWTGLRPVAVLYSTHRLLCLRPHETADRTRTVAGTDGFFGRSLQLRPRLALPALRPLDPVLGEG
jgi:hypothetical protein